MIPLTLNLSMSLLPSFSAWRLQSTWNIKFQVCVHTLILIQTRLAAISRVKKKVFPRCIYFQANSFLAHSFMLLSFIIHPPLKYVIVSLTLAGGLAVTEQTSSRVMLCLLWVKECQPVTRGASEQTQGLECTLRRWDERESREQILFREREHQGVDGIHFPEEKLKTFKVSIMCVCRNPQVSRRFVLSHE